MAISTQWQLARDAAERYEQVLVPTILGPIAKASVDFAALRPGDAVLDVGCGTGAAARCAAERVAQSGRVVGVDVNPGMIQVAQSLPPVEGAKIEWLMKSAYELPAPEGSFDVVLCAQTLQFLDDRPRGLAEMHRVLKAGGRVAVSLWCDMRESPYFEALVAAVTSHVGAETAMGLRAIFSLSDLKTLRALVEKAGFRDLEATVKRLNLLLPELADFVPRHVSATPMAESFRNATNHQQRSVIHEMTEKLASYKTEDGFRIPFATNLLRAVK